MSALRLLPSRAPARVLAPVVRRLAAAGVTPAMITVAGLLGNVAAAVLIATGSLALGGVVMLLASGVDMLDGALARATGRASRFGALLDSVLDRASEVVVLFGVLVYSLDLEHHEEAMLAFAALAGSLLVSYVRARVEGLGLTMSDGLFRRQERVVLLGAGLVVGWLRLALWILAVLSLLTAAQRLYLGLRAVKLADAAGEETRAPGEQAEDGR